MKKLFLFLLLCYLTKAEINVKCSDNLQNGLTFEATNDGVEGRYRVEWCTMADKNVTNWELIMRYYDTRSPSRCMKYSVDIPLGTLHSRFNEIVQLDLNCTNICFSTNLDLIFNGTCYHIKTVLHRGTTSSSPHDSLHYVNNPYPKEHFTKSMALVRTHSTNEELIVHWYLGFVPATDYSMNLCTEDFQWCVDIGGNCSTLSTCRCEVRCVLRVPAGCYSVRLKQLAPWTEALQLFGSQTLAEHHACHSAPPPTPADVSRAALWWLCAGAALAALAALVLALLLRAHRARPAAALRARVLRHWLDRTEAEATKPINNNEAGERRVLLLYARDCPAPPRGCSARWRRTARAWCCCSRPAPPPPRAGPPCWRARRTRPTRCWRWRCAAWPRRATWACPTGSTSWPRWRGWRPTCCRTSRGCGATCCRPPPSYCCATWPGRPGRPRRSCWRSCRRRRTSCCSSCARTPTT